MVCSWLFSLTENNSTRYSLGGPGQELGDTLSQARELETGEFDWPSAMAKITSPSVLVLAGADSIGFEHITASMNRSGASAIRDWTALCISTLKGRQGCHRFQSSLQSHPAQFHHFSRVRLCPRR